MKTTARRELLGEVLQLDLIVSTSASRHCGSFSLGHSSSIGAAARRIITYCVQLWSLDYRSVRVLGRRLYHDRLVMPSVADAIVCLE